MPDLLSLPEELFCIISNFVHPQTIVDWACSCKTLSRCSLKALETHNKRQSALRLVHDLNPMSIPSLLRDASFHPEILWYVRALEVWDHKERFKDWKSPHFSREDPYHEEVEESRVGTEKHDDYSYLDATFYDDEELKRYRNILSKWLHLDKPFIDKWMKRLHSGGDEPLKLLLMATSPTLTQLTFVKYYGWQMKGKHHPTRMLASVLRTLAPLPSPEWPCFQLLKTVSIGHSTEVRNRGHEFTAPSSFIAPLLLLPAIETLQLNYLNLEYGDRTGPDSSPYVWEWGLNRSSCQNLIRKWLMII